MNGVTVAQIRDWLNVVAPFDTAESYDNVGLLAGDPDTVVHSVLFALDLTRAVLENACALGAELVIVHHPLIFSPLRRIDYTIPQGQALMTLVSRRMSLLAVHTNWDMAQGGVGDALARALGLLSVVRGDAAIRLGALYAPMTPEALARHIRLTLNVEPKVYGTARSPLARVACAPGAYGEGVLTAYRMGAQAYITGEIHHHEILEACELGMVVYDAGHAATELPGVSALYHRFLSFARGEQWRVEAHLDIRAPYLGATKTP